ncbi:tetratricopeptide repeat protein [Ferruginibacter sp.]
MPCKAQSDQELNRDSVIGWQYIVNPINAKAAYKPIKSQYANNATYTVGQQQASDMLINWIQQSYLPRGIVMRTIAKNDERWYVDGNGPLQSYGVNFLGYAASFAHGKIDLRCCEQGQRLQAGFNDFPGVCIKGFNPGGLYFFAEQAPFTSGDDDAQLSKEGIDKKIQSGLYNYRTYFDHYHDNGQQVFRIGVVVPKNGDWPFKPVLVKDAVAYIQQQMAAYPGIMQKNPYSAEPVKKALERLQPYYNEVVKLNANYNYSTAINDDNGHYLLNPEAILNGKPINKTFPEYNILVITTQQTIDQTKTDDPLWMYLNLTPSSVTLQGNPAKFDTKFGTGVAHMVYSLLNNFNFDYVAKWLAQPAARKSMAYAPAKMPAKVAGNVAVVPVAVSATASAKNKDPYTILYEDFEGYPAGEISAKKWHTAGYGFANASLITVNGQNGKWVMIPEKFTFYPDLDIPLTANYTVSYDVYFGAGITNKRVSHYCRLDAYDPKDKYPQPMNMASAIDKGMDFAIAMSGEGTIECKFRKGQYKEMFENIKLPAFKEKDIAHVSVSVSGTAVAVSVNGKEVIRNDNAMPVELPYKRVGWYCSNPNMLLGNIFIKSNTAVQNNTPKESAFAGVVKEKTPASISDAATFETSDYSFKPLQRIDNMPPLSYPAGFKSTAAIPAQPEGSNKAVASLPTFKTPARSALLDALPNAAMSSTAFKKIIDDLKGTVAAKLNADNAGKIDAYLKTKKITSSNAITNEAVTVWIKGKPTAALYLFCKALQSDYNDMNTANNLAALLNTYGYAEKAIAVLQYVNSRVNGSPDVLANLAVAYYNLGDMDNALLYAGKSIDKDSLNTNANKVAAFVHLNKASQSNNKAEADKAIGCLKRSLKSHYDPESSELLNKIEDKHQKQNDFINTNFNEFPMLRRLELPAMTEDLAQAQSFNRFLEKEKSALLQTADDIRATLKKIPAQDMKQVMDNINQHRGTAMLMIKAAGIINQTAAWYMKMKGDLEQLFTQDKTALTTAYNKKISAISKKYSERLNKLEGGEGKGDEEEEIERLKKARCEEYNKESAQYLADVAKLTNQFAQKSELVSRTYFRDYANWMPVQLNDTSIRYLLDAQAKYISDVSKILSLYTAVEPCIYPSQQIKNDNTKGKPKQWDDKYCPAILNQELNGGAVSVRSTCTSFSVEGGEGLLGELTMNYNEDGTFKDITIGVGIGAEANVGIKGASVSAGASAKEYITISASQGGPEVSDWGVKAGVNAGANAGPASGEVNIASTNISANGGVTAGGVLSNALGLPK